MTDRRLGNSMNPSREVGGTQTETMRIPTTGVFCVSTRHDRSEPVPSSFISYPPALCDFLDTRTISSGVSGSRVPGSVSPFTRLTGEDYWFSSLHRMTRVLSFWTHQ